MLQEFIAIGTLEGTLYDNLFFKFVFITFSTIKIFQHNTYIIIRLSLILSK